MSILTLLLLSISLFSSASSTSLDDYVWMPDPHFRWFDTGARIEGASLDNTTRWVGYILNVTSQQWLTPEDVSLSIWTHFLVVIVPDNVKYKQNATLWICGGGNPLNDLPEASDEDITIAAGIAMAVGNIAGALFQIPNQEIYFAEETAKLYPEPPYGRKEDAIIAYTWDHFLRYPDQPEWLVRFPMVCLLGGYS